MGKNKQTKFVIIISLTLVGLTQFPYLMALWAAPPDSVFAGFLINPLDGNSYIAKMYEGYRGDWLFTLPYTAQVGKGTFLFFFYILLGHLARWLHLSVILVYHLVRAISSVVLVWVFSVLVRALFKDIWSYRFALFFGCFGSGMGWLAMPTGYITSDFWVAEAYPFLSALTNPHFCLSMALMLWLIRILVENKPIETWWIYAFITLAVCVLGLLAPFGVVIVGLLVFILIAKQMIFSIKARKEFQISDWRSIFCFFVCIIFGGAPIMLYEVYVINTDPLLQAWNAQNITASPPIWDLLLSFSPLLILALFGVYIVVDKKIKPWGIIVAWLVLGVIFVYIPWSLQRRFLFGLHIPIALLATLAVQQLRENLNVNRFRFYIFLAVLCISSFTTNLVLEITTLYGIKTKDSLLYLTNAEYQALLWIEENTPSDAIIVASPQMGLYIPAHSGRRVLYGHPFETVDAETREDQLTAFYANFMGEMDEYEFLIENRVDYIFYGPRERKLCTEHCEQTFIANITSVFNAGDVVIYQLDQ